MTVFIVAFKARWTFNRFTPDRGSVGTGDTGTTVCCVNAINISKLAFARIVSSRTAADSEVGDLDTGSRRSTIDRETEVEDRVRSIGLDALFESTIVINASHSSGAAVLTWYGVRSANRERVRINVTVSATTSNN